MKIVFLPKALDQFSKLDKSIKKNIQKFIKRLETLENPRSTGKGLSSNLAGLWRYRVGDYRLICKIDDDNLIIIVVEVGHRSSIYNK